MALHVDEYEATGEQPHNVLTGRYACYDTYRAADDRWLAVAAVEHRFWANLCRLLGLERWIDHQNDDTAQDCDPCRSRRRVRRPDAPRDWVELLADADTCVTLVRTVAEAAADDLPLAGTRA